MRYFRTVLQLQLLIVLCAVLNACSHSPRFDELESNQNSRQSSSRVSQLIPSQIISEEKPYLILISIDGLGWSLPDQNNTPALDSIAANGIRAKSLQPVFPTMTFPNHYSIATGLTPAEHGIVDNNFPNQQRTKWYRLSDRSAVHDGRWYGGEPIWVSAEKNKIISATYYFVGSEAAIGEISPTYWRTFDGSIPGETRIQQALKWLSLPPDQRPHMIAMYFEDVDKASHQFGPQSSEASRAVEKVDGYLQVLMKSIDAMNLTAPVYYLVVSDHGQAPHRPASEAFVLDQHVNLQGIEVVDHHSFAALYLNQANLDRAEKIRDLINTKWKHGRAYLRQHAPEHWQISEDLRFADIYVIPNDRYAVVSTSQKLSRVDGGDHGWDPSFKAMHGVFYASGPRLPNGLVIPEVSNLEVYPLMMEILGLPLPKKWTYRDSELKPLLHNPH